MWIVSLAESLRRDLRRLSIQKGPIASTAGDEHVESFEVPTVSCERCSRLILPSGQSGQSASQGQRTGTSTAIVSQDCEGSGMMRQNLNENSGQSAASIKC
jgi:hypothetical protein